jgi:hypothetical protein
MPSGAWWHAFVFLLTLNAQLWTVNADFEATRINLVATAAGQPSAPYEAAAASDPSAGLVTRDSGCC